MIREKRSPSLPVRNVRYNIPCWKWNLRELSDTGLVREHNEDYVGHFVPATPLLVRSHGWLFTLADGVGGHEKGEVASRTAVESVLDGFRSAPGEESHSTLLPRLLQQANLRYTKLAVPPALAESPWPPPSWLVRCVSIARLWPMWGIRVVIWSAGANVRH